jgi:hypothetical protein
MYRQLNKPARGIMDKFFKKVITVINTVKSRKIQVGILRAKFIHPKL